MFDRTDHSPTAATPVFNPANSSGAHPPSDLAVTITTGSSGAQIHYTTNGTTPSDTVGTLYTGPVTIAANTAITLKAVACGATYITSAVASALFDRVDHTVTCAQPVFDPPNCSQGTPSGHCHDGDANHDDERGFDQRSQFLLDQDRAVRSANLAAIYQEDGMDDLSVREAARGVDDDYSNASSHLFLANSYNALRDPKRINLRYETPWFNELLLANLLAPVGGGPLSQFVSEQEYSKLFEANRFGISSSSSYFSTGEIREIASQYGIFGNFSYSLDTEFQYDNGRRPNNEITRSESYGQFKVQLPPQDSIFLQTKYQDTRQGDLLQRYNQNDADRGAHFRELQQPAILLAGYHHEWAPGVDTLLLAGRLADEISFTDLNHAADVEQFLETGHPNVSASIIVPRDASGTVLPAPFLLPLDLRYHSTFTTYTGEANQIWEAESNTLIAGARFQSGEFHTSDRLDNPPSFAASFFADPATAQDFNTSLERESLYLYDTWRPVRSLSITGGVSYDRLKFPANHRNSPITDSQSSHSRVSPKAGVIWNPWGKLIIRGAYTRSLGGVSFDESVLLEPNQVAGFNQVFRDIISESVVGSVAAPDTRTPASSSRISLELEHTSPCKGHSCAPTWTGVSALSTP